ncbi:MAG: MazG nucleotide pyrophosphohydrolase domain-containing protein [Patescibacteria group bacterium]
MEFKEIITRANQIKDKYNALHKTQAEPEWGISEYTQGLVSDVGELMKLIMAKQGFRATPDLDDKLKHELADCLYSICVIAHELNIDLEKEFIKTMSEIENKN